MSNFTDSDKDHLFGLLERILKMLILMAEMTDPEDDDLATVDEARKFLNK